MKYANFAHAGSLPRLPLLLPLLLLLLLCRTLLAPIEFQSSFDCFGSTLSYGRLMRRYNRFIVTQCNKLTM